MSESHKRNKMQSFDQIYYVTNTDRSISLQFTNLCASYTLMGSEAETVLLSHCDSNVYGQEASDVATSCKPIWSQQAQYCQIY